MHVIYVDDEELAITKFKLIASKIEGITSLKTFQEPEKALKYVKQNEVNVVFLDIEMPGMLGIQLAKEIKLVNQDIHVVFVTAYQQYALDAFEVEAVGYLLKPYSLERVQNELDKCKRIKKVAAHKVFIQTIPSFEVFIDGELLMISRKKVKELLALLVDRNGSTLTIGQAIAYLWEDRPDDDATKALYRMTAKRLKDLLMEHQIDYILDQTNNQRSLKIDDIQCDYYEILKGNKKYCKLYHGEYMSEYSWAEETNAKLSDILDVY